MMGKMFCITSLVESLFKVFLNNHERYMTDTLKPIWECHKLIYAVRLVIWKSIQ